MSEKINIQGVPETMLQTLYARARESQKEPHYIYDQKAIDIVNQLDYDFSAAHKDTAMSSGVIARTILLDKLTEDFLTAHPGTAVINIACGLDMRCYRMEGKFSLWYNLDLPETMAVRQKFVSETDHIRQIALSADDPAWTSIVENTDRPVLVIIEGLSMYLEESQVREIFRIIGKRFSSATVFLEIMNPAVVRHVKEKSIEGSQAKFRWGIRSGADLDAPGFRHLRDISLCEGMKVFIPVYKVLGKIPFIRNISNKISVFEK